MTANETANGTTGGGDDLGQAHGGDVATIDRHTAAPTRQVRRWALFVLLAATVVVVDQATKAWIVATVAPGDALSVVGDWLRFVHSRNSGGLFGLFRDSAALFALASVGVIGLIVVYHARSRANLLLSTALGLLLGGAIGNFIDRVRFGYVVDFVDAGIGNLRFYTFNAADSAISAAILLLILLALFPRLAGEPVTTEPGDGADD
jgi:signal peptidase II